MTENNIVSLYVAKRKSIEAMYKQNIITREEMKALMIELIKSP